MHIFLNIQMFSNCSKSSGSDHTFNFNYEIEIKTLKSKTSELNQKLDFNDFPDFRQDGSDSRTISQAKQKMFQNSKKRTGDSFFIISNPSERNLRSTWTQNARNNKNSIWQQQKQFNSPKFTMNEEQSRLQIEISSKKIDSEKEANKQNVSLRQINGQSSQIKLKKNLIDEEKQLRECERNLQYLRNQNEMIDYQGIKIEKEIEILQKFLEGGKLGEEIQQILRQTQQINEKICRQTKIGNALVLKKEQINHSFVNLSRNLNLMNFQRPIHIKDQAFALLQQINQLRMEYQQNTTSHTSLYFDTQRPLSNAPSIQRNCDSERSNRMQTNLDAQRMIFQQAKNEIREIARNCCDPNLIRNIKYSIIKQQWQLFQNSEVIVNYSCRGYPNVHVLILNKSKYPLEDLKILLNGISVIDNNILDAQKCYKHSIQLTGFSNPFQKIMIQYQVKGQIQTIKLFLPTLPLKFGEFLPITPSQFDHQYKLHRNNLENIVSPKRKQLDLQLFSSKSLQELSTYFPNLISDTTSSRGVFQLLYQNEGALIIIKAQGLSFQVQILNNIPFLLSSLEFFLQTI